MTLGMRAQSLASVALLGCALASPAIAQNTQAAAKPTAGEGEAIVVTAERRAQTLIEVPQSVTAIGGRVLEQQQSKTFLDYAQLVPGLNVTQDNPGQSRLILRGINTGSVG